jgi:UDP-N-acetylglucosamine acyltransferase
MKGKTVSIHPLAVVSSQARIGNDVSIGAFCIVEDDVVIGNGCRLETRVSIKKGTQIGENNHIFDGAVLGGWPQHLGCHDSCGDVVIGCGNIIRENVTIHSAMHEGESTVIGNDCMLMVNSHVAHDCRIDDNVIMANNVMIAGHVSVGRRANLSGGVGVHQFCRIGAYAMVGAQGHIIQDVPPYMTVDGLTSKIVGLNQIGLRRAGFTTEDIRQLKDVYRIIYHSKLSWRDILHTLEEQFTSGPALEMARFLATTTRQIIRERRSTPEKPELKIHNNSEEDVVKFKTNVG